MIPNSSSERHSPILPFPRNELDNERDLKRLYFRRNKNKDRKKPSLTPFEKIKLDTDRTTAHGHPLILPSEYGEFGPVFDVIALFQNGVKRQTIVAYNMLEAMLRSKYEVSHVHLNLFFEWFDTFQDSIFAIFDVEEEHVYPYLEEAGVELPEGLNELAREKICQEIFASLEIIAKNREQIRHLPAGEAIPSITELLDIFLHLIIAYYDTQSEVLPQLIFEADIDGDMEIALRRIFINALRAKHNYSIYIPFVAHWLNEGQLKRWKSKYLGPVIGLRFDQWARRFEAAHGSIPHKIFDSLTTEGNTEERDVSSTAASFLSATGRLMHSPIEKYSETFN